MKAILNTSLGVAAVLAVNLLGLIALAAAASVLAGIAHRSSHRPACAETCPIRPPGS